MSELKLPKVFELLEKIEEEAQREAKKEVERMRIRGPLYYSLSLCQELFQIPVPKGVLKDLSQSW